MNDTSSAHRHAWDLIPWIVNGTAAPADQLAVQAHLQACADCHQELEFQRQLHAAMALQSPAETDMRDSWQRLRSRLDSASRAPATLAGEPQRARGAARSWMPWLVAATVVQAIGLGALGAAWLARRDMPGAPAVAAAPYRTLAAPEAAAPRATVRVVFAPEVTVAQVQMLLAAAKLQIPVAHVFVAKNRVQKLLQEEIQIMKGGKL